MGTIYQSYHTALKLAVKTGLAPKELVDSLPASTRHRFKNQTYDNLIGTEAGDFLHKVELLREISQSRLALKTAHTVLRFISLVKSWGVSFNKIVKVKLPALREKIIEAVETYSAHLSTSRVLRWLGLSFQRLVSWKKQRTACVSSPLGACRRLKSNQLSLSEVRRIKKAYLEPRTSSWPALSLAWSLIHSGQVAAHPSTIMSYAKSMGMSSRSITRKVRKRGSLEALTPNQSWHMDVTVVRCMDNSKAYVQLVIDNFSRKILGYRVASGVSGLGTKELLQESLGKLVDVPSLDIQLIVDGGPENNNRTVQAWLKGVPITKFIAQVDVTFSNSMIEAVNKILKYRYLFRDPIPKYEKAEDSVRKAIEDYNQRPHGVLKG